MCNYLSSWPVLATTSIVSLAAQALTYVTTTKTANLAIQGGTYCSNQTLESLNHAFCDSSFSSYENWNLGAKFALIGAPVCLTLTVALISTRHLNQGKQTQSGDESLPILPTAKDRTRSFSVKIADFFSSSIAQCAYGAIAASSFIFLLPGQYFLNLAAFEFGERLCLSCTAKTKYLVLKTLLNSALTAIPVSLVALGTSHTYKSHNA